MIKNLRLPTEPVDRLRQHPAIKRPLDTYSKYHYSTPLFVLRETLSAFHMHNGLGLSASLSFYAMFALIPLTLLMFFLLSHLVVSSNYAIVKLAIITSNLVPKLSQRIMLEVYHVSKHQAAWGALGMFALFWIITPLAGSLRSAFHTISAMIEPPSFIKKKIKDVIGVLGILLMFFLFSVIGLVLEKILHFAHPSTQHTEAINLISSILLSTLLIGLFYRGFFPAKVSLKHIFIGSFVTALLWMAMRPLFGIVLSLNHSYGSLFGGMKNMFISIAWLYYTFAVFLLGTELIATLRKKDVLLLRGLFGKMPNKKMHYLRTVMQRYGKTLQHGEYVFKEGEQSQQLYYLVSGTIAIMHAGRELRSLQAGDYFGEMAMLTDNPRIADAIVTSEWAEVVIIHAKNVETLLLGEPKIAMNFLKHMAKQLQNTHQKQQN